MQQGSQLAITAQPPQPVATVYKLPNHYLAIRKSTAQLAYQAPPRVYDAASTVRPSILC